MLPLLPSRCPAPEPRPRIHSASNIPLPPLNSAPRPLLQLTLPESDLFVELVQEATLTGKAPMVWVRPQLIVSRPAESNLVDMTAYSMKRCPDLLWPAHHFQPAFAEDFFNYSGEAIERSPEATHALLRQLMQSAWAYFKDSPQPSEDSSEL